MSYDNDVAEVYRHADPKHFAGLGDDEVIAMAKQFDPGFNDRYRKVAGGMDQEEANTLTGDPAQLATDAKNYPLKVAAGAMGLADQAANSVIKAVPSVYDTFDPSQPAWRRVLGMSPVGDISSLLQTGGKLAHEAVNGLNMIHPKLGVAAQMLLPDNDPAGVAMLAMGEAGKIPGIESTAGQLPLPLSTNDIRPGVQKVLEGLGADDPFNVLKDREGIENKTLSLEKQRQELEKARGKVAEDLAAQNQAMGTDLNFRSNPEIGPAIQKDVADKMAAKKAPLIDTQNDIFDRASNIIGVPNKAIEGVKQLLADRNATLLNLPQDASLNRLLSGISDLEQPTTEGGKISLSVNDSDKLGSNYKNANKSLMGVDLSITPKFGVERLNTSLKSLLEADSQLGGIISNETDDAGRMTPKGALLSQFRNQSLRPQIDQFANELAGRDPWLAKDIPALRARWNNFFNTFDNPTVRSILKADDPAKIFDNVTASEQGFSRLKDATSQPIYDEVKRKWLAQALNDVQNSKNPMDTAESYLKDPSGKEIANHLSPMEKAAFAGAASGMELDMSSLSPQIDSIEKELQGLAERTMPKRAGENALSMLQGRDNQGMTLAKQVGNIVKAHGVRYSAASGLSLGFLAIHHPVVGALTMAAGVTPDLFAHLYATQPVFRGLAHSVIDAPSVAAREGAVLALQHGTAAFLADRIANASQDNANENAK